MPEQFEKEVLDRFAEAREVRIETTGEGRTHRTIIWIVVDGGDVFVRSVRGPRGRWYRELTASGEGAVLVGRERVPVRAVRSNDASSVERCTRALREKYRGDPSTASMVRPDVLPTTLRLAPA